MDDNNIIIKITSEADLSSAQKQLQALTTKADALEKEMLSLRDAEKEDAESIKEVVSDAKELDAALKRNREYYRDLTKAKKSEITANKQSIKELEKQVKAYKTLQGQSGRMVVQLRAMRERLMEMEDAGEFGTQAFIDLSIAAGKLEDQIGDTQQRIRILASDTKNMDALMGLGDGLAGSFYIATSAAELLGDEVEGLQRAFYKVQAAMSVVSGVQQVYNAIQKDSAAMVVLNTALTRIWAKIKGKSAVATKADAVASTEDAAAKTGEAAATGLATKAQLALNAAFKANPIGIILAGVAALTAGIYALYKALDPAQRAARAARKAQKEYDKQNAESTYRLNIYAKEHDKIMHSIERDETKRLQEARKRHASELEMANIELASLEERRDEVRKYVSDAIKENNKAQVEANKVYKEREKQLQNTRKGTKAYKEAQDQLNEAERQMHDVYVNGTELIRMREEAEDAVADKEQEIADTLIRLREQRQQAQLDLMRDGQKKEIAQINLNYAERLRTITGKSKEELAMRKAIKEKQQQEILDIERKYAQEQSRILTEVDVQLAEERTKALRGNEGVAAQLAVWDDFYNAREAQMKENARMEIEEVNRSTDNEEMKAARVLQINTRLQSELTDLVKEGTQKRSDIYSQSLTALEIEAEKAADAVERAQTTGGKLDALKANLDAQLALYKGQEEELERLWDNGSENALINYNEYMERRWEITKATTDAEVEYQQNAFQTLMEGFETALNNIQQVSDLAFEALGNHVQAELDALDEMYTTDWQEAQKSADKKYITEKEYEKKKAALEMKQAKYAKAQAIINAGINTALAVVTTLSQLGATPWGIAASVIAAAMGAAQIAVIASKPLAQYEKGRKGGKGEYALVGEKGAEIMYVPQGASIVPHDKIDKPAAWAAYGVPKLETPAMPNVNAEVVKFMGETGNTSLSIDYDKLGKAVARNIPQQKSVTVNVDRSGIRVDNGRSTRTYLNTKYQGSWN